MSTFKASAYRITIQESDIEGQTYFVGSVAELPDVAVYEGTYSAAYEAITQVIEDLKVVADKEGRPFPSPTKPANYEASGRVTLRMPKTLHATLERQARAEDISLNQHLVYLLAEGSARLEQKSQSNATLSQVVRAVTPQIRHTFAMSLKAHETTPGKVLAELKAAVQVLRYQIDASYEEEELSTVDFDPLPYAGSTYARQ